MSCSNYCTLGNLNEIESWVASVEKAEEQHKAYIATTTAGADPIEGTFEHQIAAQHGDPLLIGALVATVLVETIMTMFDVRDANAK